MFGGTLNLAQFKLDAEIIAAEVQRSILFFHTSLIIFFQQNSGLQATAIWVVFGVQAAETPNYPAAMCRFPLFVALCGRNPPTLQTDEQTDVMLVAQAQQNICAERVYSSSTVPLECVRDVPSACL